MIMPTKIFNNIPTNEQDFQEEIRNFEKVSNHDNSFSYLTFKEFDFSSNNGFIKIATKYILKVLLKILYCRYIHIYFVESFL